VQAATRARAMKFIEVGRAKAGFSLWERRSASRYCEHVLRASELWSVPFGAGNCIFCATAAASVIVVVM
jgi:hypothetical protein